MYEIPSYRWKKLFSLCFTFLVHESINIVEVFVNISGGSAYLLYVIYCLSSHQESEKSNCPPENLNGTENPFFLHCEATTLRAYGLVHLTYISIWNFSYLSHEVRAQKSDRMNETTINCLQSIDGLSKYTVQVFIQNKC